MKTKKIIAGLLATAMVITGFSVAPKKAEAAVATDIIYEIVDAPTPGEAPVFDGIEEGYLDPVQLYSEGEDPVEADITEEYLFGGWYQVCELDTVELVAIEDENYNDMDGATGMLFAKWVPASVLSVKAQNHASVAEGTTANIRVLSSVDSLDYQTVGFAIEINNSGEELPLAAAGTTKVYESLVANGKTVSPSTYFGAGATHFVVWTLTGVPAKGHDDIIYVRPYWVTADGVRVDGLGKYVHVEDGYKGYISVPVNLNKLSEDNVAAGVVEISYPDGFTLVEDKVEMGRVFGEMEFADKGSSVKFAANVEDINKNAKANDIYVNLRFTYDGTVTHASNDFEIQGTPDFCNNEEVKVDIDIWDVLY